MLLSGKGCNWGHSRDAWEGAADDKSRIASKELCSQGQTAQAVGGFPPRDPKLASVVPPCAPVASSPCRSCLFVPFFLQFDAGGVGISSPSDFQFVLFLFDFHCPLPWLALAGGSSSGPVSGHKAFLFSWESRRILHEYVKGWFFIYMKLYYTYINMQCIFIICICKTYVLYLIDPVQNQ